MSKIKIETLTSVHIGSGETLQYGTDFVPDQDAEGYGLFGVVDPKKILNLIGEEHIGNWLSAIERRDSTKTIIKQFAPHVKLHDYSKRILLDYCDEPAKNGDTLKEFIHDGMGKPYIPGSSIKGAIRTSVLAALASKKTGLYGSIKDRKGKPTAKNVESSLFGADPNSDVFRFLQIGDAIFEPNCEEVHRMVNINERERKSFWDKSKPQMVETIGPNTETEFQLKLSSDYYDFAKRKWPQSAKNKLGTLPDEMQTLQKLFQTINENTKILIESEIDYWEEKQKYDDSGKVGEYISRMEEILDVTTNCQGDKECVLRIGHGSGWRFITGAWTEELDNFSSLVVPVSRPRNQNYEQYDFPKTRRVDDYCELLGFVKLTILE